MSTISAPGAASDNSSQYWEKKVADVNNIDETYGNSRDLGYLRYNHSRLSAVGTMSDFDNVDIYKFSVQSAGEIAISIRNDNFEDDGPDFSKYYEEIDRLQQQTDPEGYAEAQAAKKEAEENQELIQVTAPGMKMEVYSIDKMGREILVADSSAGRGSELGDTLDSMLKGEYEATAGNYFIKVSRDESIDENKEMSYAMQLTMGEDYKHDYAAVETASEDTRNKVETKIPLATANGGILSPSNVMEIQASRYQGAAQMMQVGMMNIAELYNKNNNL